MKKHILFIQGGGDDGHNADKPLVSSLQKELGDDFETAYPEFKSDESAADFGWPKAIEKKMEEMQEPFMIVAHSLGASMLLKYLSETKISSKPSGIFLLATPFWSGMEDWKQGLKLRPDFADHLPKNIPLFFYHCKDDEEVPFAQLLAYKDKLMHAKFQEINNGGHMFEADLKVIADNIKNL